MSDLSSTKEQIKVMNLNYNMAVMQNVLDPIKKFQVRNSDIFIMGYPKSGTTWASEMIWLIGSDLDFDGAKNFCIDERFPILEYTGYDLTLCDVNFKLSERHQNSIPFIEDMKSPRFIKTHLPGEHLPEQLLTGEKKPKIIYMIRDVKDVCISSYYYQKNILNLVKGSLNDYCDVFMNEGIFAVGDYWKNVLYFWERKDEDHILVINYEEMKQNLPSVLHKVAKHLNKTLTKEQEIKLVEWLGFDSMKKNSAVNFQDLYNNDGFMRVGKTGEHKKEMTAELISKFNIWSKRHLTTSDFPLLE